MEQLPQDIHIVNLSLGGYTDDDSGPLAIANALRIMRKQRGAVVAAAGNAGQRPPVLARRVQAGARRRGGRAEDRRGAARPTATTAGGSTPPRAAPNLQSTFAREKTKVEGAPRRDRLRRLGGVGRDVVRDADRRRDDRPHDVAQRHHDGRRSADPSARDLARPRRSPTSRSPSCFDELEGCRSRSRSSSRGSRSARRAAATCSRSAPARRPSSTNRPRSSACTLSGPRPGRSTVTVASPGGSS